MTRNESSSSRVDGGGNRVRTITRAIKGLHLEANNANSKNSANNAVTLIKYEGGTLIDLTQDDDTDLTQDDDADLTQDDDAEYIPDNYTEKKGNRLKYYEHPP